MQPFCSIYAASFHLVPGVKSVLIAHEAGKYQDDAGLKCSAVQLFNFFRNMRRVYTTVTKDESKSGIARRKKPSGPLVDKCREVFAQDHRTIVRRNRGNKQTSETVCISSVALPLKIHNF